jgi:nucleoside-diphosphate-sugar epimerase
MQLFITGASGFIGGAVARHLKQTGHVITALARSDASAEKLAAAGFQVHRGDVSDPQSFAAAITQADGVIHTAVGGPRGVTDVDTNALQVMIDGLAGRSAPLLLTSGLGVYAGIKLPVVDEATPLDPTTLPQGARIRLEAQALDAAKRGVRVVVLRPSHTYGQGQSGTFTRMQLDYAQRSGSGGYIGEGAAPYGSIHIDDLVASYVAALDRAPAGALYNLVGNTITTRELAGAVSHATGAGGRTVSLTMDQAKEAWGPLAGLLAGGPQVAGLRAVVELGATAKAPSLPWELVHGSLRRAAK